MLLLYPNGKVYRRPLGQSQSLRPLTLDCDRYSLPLVAQLDERKNPSLEDVSSNLIEGTNWEKENEKRNYF